MCPHHTLHKHQYWVIPHWSCHVSYDSLKHNIGSNLINDIGSNLSSTTRLFADDCTIYREVSKQTECEMLQKNLNTLHLWIQKWQLSLNASKCKAMRFTNKRKINHYMYHLNNTPLEWYESYKYLGVILNNKLT